MSRARKTARWSTILGLATLFASPAHAQYVWSLGDLSDVSSRLNVNWDLDNWADAYDTEAELVANGFAIVTLDPANSAAFVNPKGSCSADGTEPLDQDQTILQDYIDQYCGAAASPGQAPTSCNTIFKIPANCQLDVLASTGSGIDGPPVALARFSRFGIIGTDAATSRISANNRVSSNTTMIDPLIKNAYHWGDLGGADGSTYTWSAGSTQGTSSISISGSCAGLTANDMIELQGTDEDGNIISYITRFSNTPAGSNCALTIVDPLPTTFPRINSIVEKFSAGKVRTQIYMNFTIGYPLLPAGVGTNSTGLTTAIPFMNRGAETLFQGMVIGPFGQVAIDRRGVVRDVLRHSTIGPALHTMRRQNNSAAVAGRNDTGSLSSYYDNILLRGAVRTYMNDGSMQFGYLGFNYQVDQLPTDPREGGDYCVGITNPQGFPNVSAGPEKSVFLNHDPSSGTGRLGRTLIEANDFKCEFLNEAGNDTYRYFTVFRNRFIGQRPLMGWTNGASTETYVNLIANRVGIYSFNGGTHMPNALGRWNTAVTSMSTPGGIGVSWPTSGTGKNYVDSGPHDDYATTNIPPSLAFRTNTVPGWWCQESGSWDGTLSFGYGDGGDNGGTPRKLPAQIRHEGGTCTPPTGTINPLSAPVFLE